MAEALAAKAGIFVATATATALIDLVTKRAAGDGAMFVWGSRNHRERLTRKLARVQAFLEDLGTKSEDSKVVDDWLNAVKTVAYLADNVMDDFAYQTLRTKLQSNNNNNNNCFPGMLSSYNISFRFRMYCKVREILAEFDKVDMDAQAIGLRQVEIATNARAAHNNQNNEPISAAWNQAREHATHTAGFIGRDEDVKVLLDMLCPPANHIVHDADGISTLAIVGMGGLGKTTLARRLYDHERTEAHFGKDNKHWVSATDFNVTRILNEIAESVPSSRPLSNTDVIIRNLKSKMKGIKSLVVLDDVWEDNGELWNSFKGRLCETGALLGSVILITTRKQSVAIKAGVASPHLLQPLSSGESWTIMEKSLNGSNVSHMKEVGRRIIEKCKGVPLAIKVMASLLKSKQRLSDWVEIEKSEIWDLPQGQTEILPSLLLSFNHLPSPCLKQCFAYCAMIPKGSGVSKIELFGLWLSQGYLRDDKRTTMEDIGEEYLHNLVSHSLLLVESKSGWDGVVEYKMHDLVYDLAVHVSGNDLVQKANYPHQKGCARHLVFNHRMRTSNVLAELNVVTVLRTIRFEGCVPRGLLIHARYLHTLFLDRTGITEVPSAIEQLKHLRYLDVSYNPISTLPDSIAKLYQLETLVLQECKKMGKLPKALNKLVSLRHISATYPMYAWKGLGQLSNLQTLPPLRLNNDGEGWSIDELGELGGLSDEIEITGLEFVKDKEQARKASLGGKAKVTKLTLSWGYSRRRAINDGVINDEDVLDGLEPHPNITSLKVKDFNGEKFPTWFMRMGVLTAGGQGGCRTLLSNLTEVKLAYCGRCRILPSLGQLPVLERLFLDGLDVECIGKEFYGSDVAGAVVSFKSLRVLAINRFGRLTTWMAPPQEAFPRLEVLQVVDCCVLESPLSFVNNTMVSVSSLSISCYRVEQLRSVLGALHHLPRLLELNIDLDMKEEEMMRESLSHATPFNHHPSLRDLSLWGATTNIKTLPRQLGLLAQITELAIMYFEDLEEIPDWICDMSSLERLELINCVNLKSLPPKQDLQRLLRLNKLTIKDCPMLAERYAKDNGPEWSTISHITTVDIYTE